MQHDPYFIMLARYNVWANERLLGVCAQLHEAEYLQSRPSFFGSIHATLNHVLVGDRLWIARIEGRAPPALKLDQILYGDLAGLRVARTAEDHHIVNVVSAIASDDLDRELAYRNVAGEAHRTPLRLVLGHVFNHQTHHRGQVHAMLSGTPLAPPPLDLIQFVRETRSGAC